MSERKIDIFKLDITSGAEYPYANHGIQAGFPSPAQDYIDEAIDLNKIVVKNPASTFFGRVRGDSLCEDDICDGDIVIIDKSLEAKTGDLAVCAVDGEFTLKYIDVREDGIWLVPANRNFEPLHIEEGTDFEIWGIVTYTLKQHRKKKK